MSPAAILFVRFHDSFPSDSNELCILSHSGVIVTAETSVVSCIGLTQKQTHLEGGNYYAGKFVFKLMAHCGKFDFEYAYDQ